jgi:hypothetical protein
MFTLYSSIVKKKMRPKTILILLLVIVIIVLVWLTAYSANSVPTSGGDSKKYMILAAVIAAFILGYTVGRPSSHYRINSNYRHDHDHEHSDTLSDEDRDYIS